MSETLSKVVALSQPVYERLIALRNERAAELGRQVTVTEVVELLLADHEDWPVMRRTLDELIAKAAVSDA